MYTEARSYVAAALVLTGAGVVAVDPAATRPPTVEAPVALAASVETIINNFDTAVTSAAVETSAASTAGDAAILLAAFQQAELDLASDIRSAISTLSPGGGGISSFTSSVTDGLTDAINDIANGLLKILPSQADPAINALVNRVDSAIQSTLNGLGNLIGPILSMGPLATAVQTAATFLTNILGGTTGFLASAAVTPAATALQAKTNTVATTAGVTAPSTVLTTDSAPKVSTGGKSANVPTTVRGLLKGPDTASPATLPATSRLATVVVSQKPSVLANTAVAGPHPTLKVPSQHFGKK
jgi:hypothetical protein